MLLLPCLRIATDRPRQKLYGDNSRQDAAMDKSKGHNQYEPVKEFFAAGELSAEGRYRDGKRHGKWKFYTATATLRLSAST